MSELTDSRQDEEPRATILDVARRAGVAVGTVSYVLNSNRNVSEARRNRVLAAIDQLNYVPNSLAQGLRRGQSRLVGICLPDTTSAYFAQLMQSLEGIAARNGFEVVHVLSHQDPELEHRRLSALLAHQLAGLLFIPSALSGRSFDLITQAKLPTVILDRATGGAQFDEVTIDNRAAMHEVAERLIALGHRRLLFIVSYPQLITTRQRIEAFRRAATGSDLPVSATVMRRGEDEQQFGRRLADMLQRPDRPTALIASNTLVGLWMMRALQPLGLRCPRDLSLLVFDHPDWADILQPRLSVVEHPTAEMAVVAWDMLQRRMRDSHAPRRQVLVRTELVLSPSVGAPPDRNAHASRSSPRDATVTTP
jgi:LacI family transcriptional regulator